MPTKFLWFADIYLYMPLFCKSTNILSIFFSASSFWLKIKERKTRTPLFYKDIKIAINVFFSNSFYNKFTKKKKFESYY